MPPGSVSWQSMARPCGTALTISRTGVPHTYSLPSPSIAPSYWLILSVTISQTRYLPCFEQAAAIGIHLIAQVKANQPGLHDAIAAHCETAAPLASTHTSDPKRRCRDELRLIELFAPGDSLADSEWAGHVKAFIRVTRNILHRSAATGLWEETSEIALFAANTT